MFIFSLDAEKASDCCNWLKLFENLAVDKALPNVVIKTLIQLYIKGEASVRYQNQTSSLFKLSQGVRQGFILSPHLFNFYIRDILHRVISLEVGTYLSTLDTSIIAFADDIILLSPSLRGLQSMIDKCVEFGNEHLIRFNDKTQFVISGKSHISDPSIIVNGNHIRPKEKLVHLGFNWGINTASN